MCCGIRECESGEYLLANVGFAVAVGVFEVPEVGRIGDENAFPPPHHARGHDQLIRKDRCAVGLAIAVVSSSSLTRPTVPSRRVDTLDLRRRRCGRPRRCPWRPVKRRSGSETTSSARDSREPLPCWTWTSRANMAGRFPCGIASGRTTTITDNLQKDIIPLSPSTARF